MYCRNLLKNLLIVIPASFLFPWKRLEVSPKIESIAIRISDDIESELSVQYRLEQACKDAPEYIEKLLRP